MRPYKGGFQWQNWNLRTGYKPNQWRSTVFAPLCAFCNKAVYPAEEVNARGKKFHKLCLKCTSCSTLLNTSNLNEHKRKIYCVTCYRQQYSPRGVGRDLGANSSFNVYTPSNSPNLNNNRRYDRKASIGSSLSRTSSEDDSRYSTLSIHKVTYPDRITIPKLNSRLFLTNLTAFKTKSLSGNICPRCSKIVYSAEEIKAVGKSFHKRCYNCAHCNGSISVGCYSEHNGEVYDNNCHQRLFGLKGILSIGMIKPVF